ncbi:RING-H2 finger protein ATL16-like [Coffea arabica]|uniref:RING-type E3 ubiquitin transferase n=1 Tax=Coffea arabica TaxID=13443 RepID=A0ABM4X993_COFAR
MDQLSQKYSLHDSSQTLPPMITPPSSLLGSTLHSSHSGFPIIAVAIIGILATGFLLVGYYIFVIKCCLNWHRIDLLRRFSFSRRRQVEDPLMANSPAVENRGLDEAAIRSIPIFQYKKFLTRKGEPGERSFCECAVCLNEFQEEEKLRVIPNCAHVFHIDCIDVWLQNNANCPLCRTSISVTTRFPLEQIMAPISFSPRDPTRYRDNFTGRDEDYVVIEIGEQNRSDQSLLRAQERLNSGELSEHFSFSPTKLQEQKVSQKKKKKFNHVSSMGDECIDIRKKDEQFVIQPIRRSFSMNSAADLHLSLAVQEIIQQQRQISDVISPASEGCSSRVRRSLFSFGHGRTSRSAVLPVHLEP